MSAAARYRASTDTAQVGGDFYDLPDGAVGLAIGDVVGHDLLAAAAMGHLRGLLRACAWDIEQHDGRRPGTVPDRVDRLLQGLHAMSMATLAYARLEPPGDPNSNPDPDDTRCRADRPVAAAVQQRRTPTLLLRHSDGRVDALNQADGLLLCVRQRSLTR